MPSESLEDKIARTGSPVRMLRNAQQGSYEFPMPGEYSNWRDEQRAWRTTAVLFNQSFHMTDIYFNVGGWSSLAVLDEDVARDGERLTLVWGEPDGGTAKPTVERHVQTEVRVTVSTSPLV
jgi:glycine cleavage system aminomethyltransferase T